MTLLADIEDFVHDHRPHGPLTGDTAKPAWNGYLLIVACPCGVVFERWVTLVDAATELSQWDLELAGLNRGDVGSWWSPLQRLLSDLDPRLH